MKQRSPCCHDTGDGAGNVGTFPDHHRGYSWVNPGDSIGMWNGDRFNYDVRRAYSFGMTEGEDGT